MRPTVLRGRNAHHAFEGAAEVIGVGQAHALADDAYGLVAFQKRRAAVRMRTCLT